MMDEVIIQSDCEHDANGPAEATPTKAGYEAISERTIRIMDAATYAFFIVDNAFHFVYLNPEAERIFGASREELAGKNLFEAYPGLLGTVFEEQFRRAMSEQKTVEFE